MKPRMIWMLVLVIGLTQPLRSNARTLFQLKWQGTSYSTSPTGKVAHTKYSEKNIIQQCAGENGIGDLKSLAFVYDADSGNAEVVLTATGETVCPIFQFQSTDITSPDDTQTVRQAFIFDQAHGKVTGSVFGTLKKRRDVSGNLFSFSYRGSFQFSIPETDTVYSGHFSTGKRLSVP